MSTSPATSPSQSSGTSATTGTSAALAILVALYATISIKKHIPVTLEMAKPDFNQWEPFFSSLYGKFGLLSHVDGTAEANPTDPA